MFPTSLISLPVSAVSVIRVSPVTDVTYKFQDLRPSVAGSVWEEEEEGERGEGEGDETLDLTLVDPPAISGVGEDTASGEEDSGEAFHQIYII